MNNSGSIELLMPSVQPSKLWEDSGRWDVFGPQMLKIKDRHDNNYCYGPTHEEVIVDISKEVLKSYKSLPINLYQIQTKFRDEIRPRYGVMRAREFIMKDAYSFHESLESLENEYQNMHIHIRKYLIELVSHSKSLKLTLVQLVVASHMNFMF